MKQDNNIVLFIQTIFSFTIIITGFIAIYIPDLLIATQAFLALNMFISAYSNIRNNKYLFALSYILMGIMCIGTIIILVVR